MKVRLALVTMLAVVFVGTVSIAVLAEEYRGTISGEIRSVLDVKFNRASLNLGRLPATGFYNGVEREKYLEIEIHGNVNYTVQVYCSGNLEQDKNTNDERYEIETEYAIWKWTDWNDNWSQQPGGTEPPYEGWLPAVCNDHFYYNKSFDASKCWFDAEPGHTFACGGNVDDNTATGIQWFNNIDYIPTKYFVDLEGRHNFRYNYGSHSKIRIYPYLDMYEEYGTPAGTYSGTITFIIKQAESWAEKPKDDYAYDVNVRVP